MKRAHVIWGAALLVLGGAGSLWASRRHKEPAAPVVAAKAEPSPRKVIVLPEATLKQNPITTTKVVEAKLAPELQVVGSVTYDQDHFAVVGPLVPGRIVALKAAVGDTVKSGQVLAYVESAEVGEAQADLLSAQARAGAAQKNALREQELAAKRISSEREREVAEAQAASESADVRAAQERLKAFGVTTGDQASRGGRVALRSPIDGTVVKRMVTLGQAVERATDAFEIAHLGMLWVMLDLYEKDLRNVHVGQQVELRSEAAPGTVFRARVAYVNPLIDMQTRTANVRIEIEQTDGRLRPGQFVTAHLLGDAQNARDKVLAVPRKAVQTVDGKPMLFRKVGAGFEPVSVDLGAPAGDLIEVSGGIAAGDEVAVDGAFLLKSELLR